MVAEGVRDQPFALEGIVGMEETPVDHYFRETSGVLGGEMISACPDGEDDGDIIFCRNGMGTLSVGTIAL